MKSHAVLSVLGPDRIGVADDLAAALSNRKIEIEETRMTALKGQFAAMVQVCGEKGDISKLQHEIGAFGKELGFLFQMENIRVKSGHGSKLAAEYLIESYCQGAAGLSAVTGVLKRNDINIEDMKTEAAAAPWTSRLSFHMTARVTVPSTRAIDKIREELHELERQRDVDVMIKPAAELANP